MNPMTMILKTMTKNRALPRVRCTASKNSFVFLLSFCDLVMGIPRYLRMARDSVHCQSRLHSRHSHDRMDRDSTITIIPGQSVKSRPAFTRGFHALGSVTISWFFARDRSPFAFSQRVRMIADRGMASKLPGDPGLMCYRYRELSATKILVLVIW